VPFRAPGVRLASVKRKAAPLPSRTGPSHSPGFLLWKVSNSWQRKIRAALQPLELTHSQFVILATATWFSADAALTQARLAELSGVDPMTTSQIVRALEAAGWIARDDHPGDPRAKAITVTAGGRELARRAVVAVERADAEFFAPLADHGELVGAFQRLLGGAPTEDDEAEDDEASAPPRRARGGARSRA